MKNQSTREQNQKELAEWPAGDATDAASLVEARCRESFSKRADTTKSRAVTAGEAFEDAFYWLSQNHPDVTIGEFNEGVSRARLWIDPGSQPLPEILQNTNNGA
ncbi:hypothetical protein [uncultured Roseobacter sp.]|uniref:hypothetical protein n=1 Tax=uncultured Roseobacter sp. TaxID=114847 RepID=UPI00261973C2|nr:hypothetical protein [uncultured Roseobacter sp.]